MAGGAVIGAEAGVPLAPFTFGLSIPIGGMIGAGIGGATGKGVQEAEKAATGYYDKNPKQLAQVLESESHGVQAEKVLVVCCLALVGRQGSSLAF